MNDWHPILAAEEARPGFWRMIDPAGVEYGTVELVKARPAPEAERVPVYKCVHGGQVIGWTRTLRAGCMLVHRALLSEHGPAGGPIASWGGR